MKSFLVLKQWVTPEEFRKFSTIQGKNNFQFNFNFLHSLIWITLWIFKVNENEYFSESLSEKPVELMSKSYDWMR